MSWFGTRVLLLPLTATTAVVGGALNVVGGSFNFAKNTFKKLTGTEEK